MMAPAAVGSAVVPPEIQFAQLLAANEKRIRDRALKKLRGYMILRTQGPAGGFNQEEFLKIWKGLFYCMWMQDKPLLQEELSNNISQLIHVIENIDARHLFIETFWQTMNREWNGIDRLRLDKFYMLIRMMLRQSFEVLKRNGWNESFTEPFLNLLMREAIHPESSAAIGVQLHVVDIYLEELAKVGAKELTADQNLKFIEPFCRTAAKTKDHHLLQAIIRCIFETIVDQCPFAVEDLMRELKAGSDDDLSEDDDWSNEDKLVAKDRSLPNKLSLDGEAEENLLEAADDNIGPVLQFDYKSIADMLFELGSGKHTAPLNRKRLYKLVKKFQDLAEGTFPQDDFPEDVSTDEDDDTFSRRKWKRKSGKPLDKTKLEKEDNAGNRKIDMEHKVGNGGNTGLRKKRKKRKRKLSQSTDMLTATGSQQKEPVILEGSKELKQDNESANMNKRQKKSLDTKASEDVSAAHPVGRLSSSSSKKTLTCLVSSKKKKPKKKSGTLQKVPVEAVHQNGQVPTITEGTLDHCVSVDLINKVTKKKRKKDFRIITGNGFSEEAVKQPEKESCTELTSPMYQKVKLRKKQKLGILEKTRGSKTKIVRLKKKRKIKEILSAVEENGLEDKNEKCKTSEPVGSPIMLQKKKTKAGNDYVKFEKTTLPKPVFFRKAKGSITSMQLTKLQSSSSKKVTFGLNKNMTAEFKKTDKSILVSPQGASRVAFNPKQKPPHGVLKSVSGSPAETSQIKKSILVPSKKRPTAMDFF
ncbi:ribosomal RNA processing protein 1 homolog B [Heteronotia binoei]|uniref:ribosomal RNA processing protein 1 homolog B n=1 Tax=Heteronotia binoei TaxID=13085 RepID=UPI00292D282F|nr:ribosomal RNA processing protein 1 homolog B [Heteronotia binoei]